MKRISDEDIAEVTGKLFNVRPRTELVTREDREIAQAQLEACEKEATEIIEQRELMIEGYTEKAKEALVREIFGEIENNLSIKTDDNGIFISGYIAGSKYQAFKQKYLGEDNG